MFIFTISIHLYVLFTTYFILERCKNSL